MKIRLKKNGMIISEKVKKATSFFDRAIGLMFKPPMKDFDGLLIHPTKSIHTCFMFYNLDIIFLDKNFRIVKIIRELKPWRITWIYWNASQVLELKGGTVPKDLNDGDELEAICTN